MMMDTSTPRKRKRVKTRRLMVEFWVEGQQPHRMQGAEPQRQDACGEGRDGVLTLCFLSPSMPKHPALTTAPSMPPNPHSARLYHTRQM